MTRSAPWCHNRPNADLLLPRSRRTVARVGDRRGVDERPPRFRRQPPARVPLRTVLPLGRALCPVETTAQRCGSPALHLRLSLVLAVLAHLGATRRRCVADRRRVCGPGAARTPRAGVPERAHRHGIRSLDCVPCLRVELRDLIRDRSGERPARLGSHWDSIATRSTAARLSGSGNLSRRAARPARSPASETSSSSRSPSSRSRNAGSVPPLSSGAS